MSSLKLEPLLDRLDELKRPTGDALARARLGNVLSQLARRRFRDAASLIRFHEILLFMRAYPQDATLLKVTEKILSDFRARVERLGADGAEDFYLFADPEFSGVAGTAFSAIFGSDTVRWLAARHPTRVSFDWDGYEEETRLISVLPRLLPLVEEGAYVETPVDWRAWLRAARRGSKESELVWLVERFERLPSGEKERAELFDSLKLWTRWEFGDTPATRTHMKRRVRKIFHHDAPLLGRRDVVLARELEAEPLPVRQLSRVEGDEVLAMGRDTMTARYRELHGYTYGDARHVTRADAGRGVEIFLWGVPTERRLPTLAYAAALILKNGVPCGYAEGLTLFERTEIGLNLFYTFREGESAWIYARLMRLFRQHLGVEVFSVDPYQLGHHNAEGIESGAFWFYRKLGFRPVRSDLARVVANEERKIDADARYRTPARVLRKLASGHLIYEVESASPQSSRSASARRGEWDDFHVRNVGLAVQRRMAKSFGGDAEGMRRASAASVARALGAETSGWNEAERAALDSLALVWSLIPGLARWPEGERSELVGIVRAKAGADERRYLRRLQSHARLRGEIIKLGSRKN